MKKRCSRCKRDLEATGENFYRNASAPDGFRSYCKACCAESKRRGFDAIPYATLLEIFCIWYDWLDAAVWAGEVRIKDKLTITEAIIGVCKGYSMDMDKVLDGCLGRLVSGKTHVLEDA